MLPLLHVCNCIILMHRPVWFMTDDRPTLVENIRADKDLSNTMKYTKNKTKQQQQQQQQTNKQTNKGQKIDQKNEFINISFSRQYKVCLHNIPRLPKGGGGGYHPLKVYFPTRLNA